jgi:hypothetical protein
MKQQIQSGQSNIESKGFFDAQKVCQKTRLKIESHGGNWQKEERPGPQPANGA